MLRSRSPLSPLRPVETDQPDPTARRRSLRPANKLRGPRKFPSSEGLSVGSDDANIDAADGRRVLLYSKGRKNDQAEAAESLARPIRQRRSTFSGTAAVASVERHPSSPYPRPDLLMRSCSSEYPASCRPLAASAADNDSNADLIAQKKIAPILRLEEAPQTEGTAASRHSLMSPLCEECGNGTDPIGKLRGSAERRWVGATNSDLMFPPPVCFGEMQPQPSRNNQIGPRTSRPSSDEAALKFSPTAEEAYKTVAVDPKEAVTGRVMST